MQTGHPVMMVEIIIVAVTTGQALVIFVAKSDVLNMFFRACMMVSRNNEMIKLIASYFL